MYSPLETKQRARCQRCGGQLLPFFDGLDCLQCGANHTKEGRLYTDRAKELGLYLHDIDGDHRTYKRYKQLIDLTYRSSRYGHL